MTLYEINKITKIVAGTAIGHTESIEITEVVKQGLYLALQCVVQQQAK